MYTNTGYLDISDAELEDNTIPLRINCCGVYRLLTRVSMTTIRATGRPDYQLLYIASGKAEFVLNGEAVTIPAGSMVLYGPGEYQSIRISWRTGRRSSGSISRDMRRRGFSPAPA